MGSADDRAPPRDWDHRRSQRARHAGGPGRPSLGDRSRPAARAAAVGQQLRALLPAPGFPQPSRSDLARGDVRADGRSARVVPDSEMTAAARLAMAVTVFTLLMPTRGLAADVKLRGIAVDRRLDAGPLPADLSRLVPTIVRLSIDPTEFV